MDLRQLRYFVAVAETRHFSTAATRLQIAQSPLTHAIRQFESQFGTALFVRSTRSVELTAAGRALFDEAPGILASIGSTEDRLSQMAVGHRGVLTVAATGLAAYRILPRMGRLLAELLPGVALRFVPGLLTAAQEEALVGNRVDVGIIRPPSRHGSLGTRTLVRERMVAAVPDGPFARRESLTLTDLNRSGFVMYGVRDSVVDAIVTRACLRAGFLPHRTAESADTAVLLAHVAGGRGVAVLPESVRALTVDGVHYVPLANDVHTELALAWRSTHISDTLREMLEILTENAALLASPLGTSTGRHGPQLKDTAVPPAGV